MNQYLLDEQTTILKALSDGNRLQIIDMLSCGELCACKLLERFHITQPTLSHHMKVLMECGLVEGRKDGIWMYYTLNREKVEEFLGFLRHVTSEKDDCICGASACCCDSDGERGETEGGDES